MSSVGPAPGENVPGRALSRAEFIFFKNLTAVFESNFLNKGEVVDQIWMKDSFLGIPGRLILAEPLQLKESLRIRDGLGMPDTHLVPNLAQTPVTIKTSALGFLWICRN